MNSRLSGGRRPVRSCVAGKRPLSLSWSESSLKYLLDFFFFPQSEEYSCAYGSGRFFLLCGMGGIISCGTTHTALVPLDLVKCRMQVCVACRTEACCEAWPLGCKM